MRKNKKKPSNRPSTRKVMNPTPLKQRFKGRYIFYLIWFCCEIPKAVTEVHVSSSSSIKKESLHGLLPRRVESSDKKTKEKKVEHSTVCTIMLTEPMEWDSTTTPRKPLLVQAHCHPESRAAAFWKTPLASVIWTVLHLSLAWKEEHRREKGAVPFQAMPIKSLSFFLQNISSRIHWISCRCSKVWAQHFFFSCPPPHYSPVFPNSDSQAEFCSVCWRAPHLAWTAFFLKLFLNRAVLRKASCSLSLLLPHNLLLWLKAKPVFKYQY